MNSSPLVLAVRAISAEFARRIYKPVVIIASIGFALLLGVSISLVTLNSWWWLLLVPVIFITLFFIIAAIIAALIIKFLRPKQTSAQRREVRSFVDSLQKTSEAVQTPKFLLLFRLVKDVVFPSQQNLINELASSVSSLRVGFKNITQSFR